ncbi:Tubby -like protein [Halotydeus destructor]|nr:Tubby -like protein [Halotydeus destructor]
MSSKELLAFSVQIIPQDQVMQCTIIRDKRGLDRSLYPTYFLHLQAIVKKDAKKDDTSSPTVDLESEGNRKPTATIGAKSTFILCGRRRKKSKTYLVSSDPYDISRVNCIAKVKSNVLGTQFNSLRLNSSGQRFEMSTIIYEANVLGFKGPRKMTVLLPQPDEEAGVSLHDAWKRNKNVIVLKNKAPVWNDESQSYVLNFHGRVTQASVKNFQLVRGSPDEVEDDPDEEPVFQMANKLKLHERGLSIPSIPAINFNPGVVLDEDIVMQFGRVSDKEFTCDVTHPLTILQAFTIALSSFDSKLACE